MVTLLAFGQAVAVTPPSFAAAKEPQVVATDSGCVYVAYGMGEALYLSSSRDGGRSYTPPSKIGELPKLALGMRRGPRMVVAGGVLTVTAISHRAGNLVAFQSTDEGTTWSSPVTVNTSAGSAREGLHAMAAGADGTIACTWLDLRDQGTRLYVSFSVDGGKSWSDNRLVYASPSGTICECCHPSLAFDHTGKLYVMFRNSLEGARDMYLTSSSDMRTFTPAKKLGQGSWILEACPMDGGMLAVDKSGSIQTVWRRKDTVFLSTGADEKMLGKAMQPWMTSLGDRIALVYQRGREIVMSQGAEPVVISTNGSSPVVASSPDGSLAIAAWTEEGIKAVRLP